MFGTGEKKLKNEKQKLLTESMHEEAHKGVKNTIRSLDAKVRQKAVTFIENFAMQNALVLPGRMPTYRLNADLKMLPCTMSKVSVHREYVLSCKNTEPAVGITSWYTIWNVYCKNIVI